MHTWKIDRVAATEVSVNGQGEVVITQAGGDGSTAVVVLPPAQVSRLARYMRSAAATTRGQRPVGPLTEAPQPEGSPETSCARCGGRALGALTLVWSMGTAGQDITSASAVMMCEACSVDVVDAWNDVAEEAAEAD